MTPHTPLSRPSRITPYPLRFAPCALGISPPSALLLAHWFILSPSALAESCIVSLTPEKGAMGGGTLVTVELEGAVALGPLEARFGPRTASDVKRQGLRSLSELRQANDPTADDGLTAISN